MKSNETYMNITGIDKVEGDVCNFKYLFDTVNGKKELMIGIMDTFLIQVKDELSNINKAVSDSEYPVVVKYAHTMMSSVSIMGISILGPILQEMEILGKSEVGIKKINELNQKLNLICIQAFKEVEREKQNCL